MDTGKKRKILAGAIAVVALALAFCYATGLDVYRSTVYAVNEQRRPLEVKRQVLEKVGFDVDGFESAYQIETVMIPSSFGDHEIPTYYITKDGNRRKDTVIMAHGLNGNRLTAYPVAAMLLKHGYNVMTYDQRASGESTAELMTCGYWESYDFADCVDYVRSQAGPFVRIGAWGSSIGGATVGFYLGMDAAQEELSFALLDCPMDGMRGSAIFLHRKRMTFLPMDFRLAMGDLVTRMKLNFSYEDAYVCNAIKDTTVPVFVMNSKADRVTPYYMGIDIYRAMKQNKKALWTVEDSRHTDLYLDYPQEYERRMMDFIKGTGK